MYAAEYKDYSTGRISPHGSLQDKSLSIILQNYRRRVAKKYFACTPAKLEKFAPEGNLHISTKVDGQLFFLVKRDGKVAFISPGGRVVEGSPLFDEAKKLLQRRAGDIIIAGELFALPPKGGRPRVHYVSTALADAELAPTLGFKAFDLVSEDETDYQAKPYAERLERLETLLGKGKRVAVVTTHEGTKKDLTGYYEKYVTSGKYEGLVVRSENGFVLKLKPEISMDVVVLGYGEKVELGETRMKELVVGLLREDNQYHVLGFVGGGFSQEARLEWHSRLAKMQVPSTFRLPNKDGALCRFVRPEIVVEVKITDLLLSDSKGEPVRRMILDHKDGEFNSVQQRPFASMIFPRFVQEREDKSPSLASTGIDQAFRHVPFEGYREHVVKVVLPKSAILNRAVYLKNGGMVRKYVAAESLKAEHKFAPFFLFATDLSPKRKDAMKTELQVASTQAGLDLLVAAWKAKNVKGGWVEKP